MKKIIKKFQELNMLIIEEGAYKMKDWSKYQSVETSEKYQEQNRNEKRLQIIITTRFDKHGLIERISQSEDTQLVDAKKNS